MDQETHPLGHVALLLGGDPDVPLVAELRDRIGDGVVQAAIEGAEFVDGERRIALERQVGDRLAQVPIVMDHLVDRKAQR